MDWQSTAYHTGISQMSKCVQVLSGTLPKRGMLLQYIKSGEMRHIKKPLCIAKSRKNFALVKANIWIKAWEMDVEMGQINLGPWESRTACLKEGEHNRRLRQDRHLVAGWHQKFHGGSALQKRQGVLWSFQDYKNISENINLNICKHHCGLVVLGLRVRFIINMGKNTEHIQRKGEITCSNLSNSAKSYMIWLLGVSWSE